MMAYLIGEVRADARNQASCAKALNAALGSHLQPPQRGATAYILALFIIGRKLGCENISLYLEADTGTHETSPGSCAYTKPCRARVHTRKRSHACA